MIKCEIESCNRKHNAKGLCKKHYANFKRTGNPLGLKKKCLAPYCKTMTTRIYCNTHKYRGENNIPFGISLHKGSRNGNWKGGTSQYHKHHIMKKNRLIKLEKNPFCEECGAKATMIHHKDLSKDNHDLDNLMSVCCKCNLKPEFCKPRSSKYKRLFGGTLEELSERFNLSKTTVLKRIKKRIPLRRPLWQHYSNSPNDLSIF